MEINAGSDKAGGTCRFGLFALGARLASVCVPWAAGDLASCIMFIGSLTLNSGKSGGRDFSYSHWARTLCAPWAA